MSDLLPEPDRIEGAPHPRETARLFGQDPAEAAFLEAYNSGRMHHGWLITGPRGVGKATLAWRIARFLLATPPAGGDDMFGGPPAPVSLDISPDHPAARRMLALSEPGLFLLRRGGAGSSDNDRDKNLREGKFAAEIRVDEVRRLANFFHMSASDGGRRVVIVDAADEMNVQAANALLKMLEEPPANTTLLLVCHQPTRLLPTIRSRCRELRLTPLPPEAIADALEQAHVTLPDHPEGLAELAAGSVGEAISLINLGGMQMYRELVGLYGTLPRMDRARALALAEAAGARGAAAKLDLLIDLNDLLLTRLARSGAMGCPPAVEAVPGEAALFARLAPNVHKARDWAVIAQQIGARVRHGRAVNLDPAALILDTVFKIQQTAAG
ncbi:DNA polymerase III subunit delta' [Thalassobius vesicularis]|uniref:DNA polymerase III subunit delta n=1 Tax=Thalassobius vesicularis TaxID=1294297 RepID=A0A4S3MDU5_9RHOB|nr:DNA polymerase III subunit delta' [Thalassobius vesicularis]THD76278.1 DNA polymerase III subunit delta' [Thalassobius vesicularis]